MGPIYIIPIFSRLEAFLAGLREPTLVLLALALVFLLGVFDVLTGPELSFSLFYLAPILALTWYTDRRVGTLAAVVASLT